MGEVKWERTGKDLQETEGTGRRMLKRIGKNYEESAICRGGLAILPDLPMADGPLRNKRAPEN